MTATAVRSQSVLSESLQVVPRKHWGRRVSALLVLLLTGMLLVSLAKNPRFEWPVVGHYLFDRSILGGVKVTIALTVAAMAIGIVGAMVLALMRLSKNPVLVSIASAYIWFFRGTPQLVQMIFWGFLGALYPTLTIGVPSTHIALVHYSTNSVVSAMVAALLGLGLNEAAYASEIVRAGILSVHVGQTDAAYSIGMTPATTIRRIILPQAMKVVVPPMGNEVIGMLKTTSLVSVIAGHDLLTNTQTIYNNNFEIIPLLVVASLWYLVMTTVLSILQSLLERRVGRGVGRRRSRMWLQKQARCRLGDPPRRSREKGP